MKKLTLLLTTAVISICAHAQSFTGTYTFDSVKTTTGLTDPTPVPTATGVVFGSFSATGTPANPNAAARFSFTSWSTGATTGNDVYASFTGALDTGNYYSVTITPAVNYTLDLSSITFSMRRSGTGPRNYAVRSNADAFAANLPASISSANIYLSVLSGDVFFWNYDTTATNKNQDGSTITLSGSSFTGVSAPLKFHFYGWNAEASGGSFSVDTVSFVGIANLGSSIAEQSSEISASVYPNPSHNGIVNIDLANSSSKTTVEVYNVIGKKIVSQEFAAGGKQQIDLSDEAAGIYFVKIKNGKEEVTRKINIVK